MIAREARRIADESEGLYVALAEKGDLASIRRHMTVHQEAAQQLDLLLTAKTLRSYAGVLLTIAGPSS